MQLYHIGKLQVPCKNSSSEFSQKLDLKFLDCNCKSWIFKLQFKYYSSWVKTPYSARYSYLSNSSRIPSFFRVAAGSSYLPKFVVWLFEEIKTFGSNFKKVKVWQYQLLDGLLPVLKGYPLTKNLVFLFKVHIIVEHPSNSTEGPTFRRDHSLQGNVKGTPNFY